MRMVPAMGSFPTQPGCKSADADNRAKISFGIAGGTMS
ncbi:MAG: hypothetical protein JWR26_1072 [Pedosphaera sp.]|nr:hypothetical protein [Pedosphaera sp.]